MVGGSVGVMNVEPDVVELTVDHARFIAETLGAGSFPSVLAITTPHQDTAEHKAWSACQSAELTRMGVLSARGVVEPAVADLVRVVCFADRWLDLRHVACAPAAGAWELLRGVVARCDDVSAETVVALRHGELITLAALDICAAGALIPVLGVGLVDRSPARFDEVSLPTEVGSLADEMFQAGASVAEVAHYLDIAESARSVVESVFGGPRRCVEIVVGCRCDADLYAAAEVDVSIVDTTEGRVLVSTSRALNGEWISTFRPGTPSAIAAAIDQLTTDLPGGPWFPGPDHNPRLVTRSARDLARRSGAEL